MSTVRQKLILQFENDLPNLLAQYGYENNYTNFVKGEIAGSKVKDYPCLWYQAGGEDITRVDEGTNNQLCELKFGIGVHIQTFKEQGLLIDESEKVVNDIKRFVHNDVSITGYGTADHKVLQWNKVQSESQFGSCGIKKWGIEKVYPILDTAGGKAEIVFGINVVYYDFHNNINNYSTI